MSFYNYQSAIGGEKEKEILVFVYMAYYQLRGIYMFLVCGGGDFSVSLKRKKHTCKNFSHFYVQVNVKIYRRSFHML